MRLVIFFLAALGLLQTTAANKEPNTKFHCLVGQYGVCYYQRGTSSKTSRCGISCNFGWKGHSNCDCPKHYPNKDSWPFLEAKSQCVWLGTYEHRNKCQSPNDEKRSDDALRNEGREVTGFDDEDLTSLDERDKITVHDGRDLTELERSELLYPDDHGLPL